MSDQMTIQFDPMELGAESLAMTLRTVFHDDDQRHLVRPEEMATECGRYSGQHEVTEIPLDGFGIYSNDCERCGVDG